MITAAIINFFIGIVSFLIAAKLKQATKKRPEEKSLRFFYYGFALAASYFILNALINFLGGTVIKNPLIHSFLTTPVRGIILLAVMYFVRIPLGFLKRKKLEKVYIAFMLLAIFSSTTMAFLGLERVEQVGMRPDNFLTGVAIFIIGISLTFSLFIAAFFYAYSALKNKYDKYIFKRSLLISIGYFFSSLGAAMNYLFPGETLSARIYALVLVTIAAIFFILNVLYKKRAHR